MGIETTSKRARERRAEGEIGFNFEPLILKLHAMRVCPCTVTWDEKKGRRKRKEEEKEREGEEKRKIRIARRRRRSVLRRCSRKWCLGWVCTNPKWCLGCSPSIRVVGLGVP